MIIEVLPPLEGIWHVGRATPGEPPYRRVSRADDSNPKGGNRFDSYSGNYGTLYFATNLEVCFAETLARFRPKPELANLVREEWVASHKMGPGSIPADWRHTRLAYRVVPIQPLPFADISHPETLAALNSQDDLMAGLARFSVDEIDLGLLTGNDRRVTRYIAEYFAEQTDDDDLPRFSGIRYLSRLGDGFECWGLFEDTPIQTVERSSIEQTTPELLTVARRFGLVIH